MDIRFLEEFVSIVETKSFQETAEDLMVSQSSLTKHIHKLEEELGVRLFDRSTRSIQLNEFSSTFYPYAKQVIETYYRGLDSLKQLQTHASKHIHIAMTPGSTIYGTIELISRFKAAYPDYTVKTTETYRVADGLKNQLFDLAFATEESESEIGLKYIPFKKDHLSVMLPAHHLLQHHTSVSLQDIAGEQFIIHTKSDGSPHLETKKFLAACKKENITPNIVSSASFSSTIAKMVNEHQGIAILNTQQIPHAHTLGASIPIIPSIETNIFMIYKQEPGIKKIMKDFISFVQQ